MIRNRVRLAGRIAFTLTELLVVMAILGILASLLIPAASRITQSGRSAKCLANLHQIAAMAMLYSQDHNGVLVPICIGSSVSDARTWRVLLVPYLGTNDTKVFSCPADPIDRNRVPNSSEMANGARPASYGLNVDTVSDEAPRTNEYLGKNPGRRSTCAVRPSETIFFSDLGLPTNSDQSVDKWVESPTRGANFGYARFPSDGNFIGSDAWNIFPRHGKTRANVVFFDGHAASIDLMKDIFPFPPGNPKCLYDNY